MTGYTTSVVTNSNGDAGFRTWGSAYGPILTAGGWVQTSDTGQINWTTVSRPGTTSTAAGYEMWRMNDALQSSYPVYMKIEYGTGSSTSLTGLWITVGFATDGAGTINSTNYSTRRFIGNATAGSATPYNWYSGVTSSRVFNVEYCSTAANRRYFAVERMHNSDGSNSADGAMVWLYDGAASTKYCQLVPTTGSLPAQGSYANVTGSTNGANTTGITQIVGSNCYITPCRLFGRGEGYPMHGIVAYFDTDLTAGSSTTITNWDGTSVTIMPTGIALDNAYITNMKIGGRFD